MSHNSLEVAGVNDIVSLDHVARRLFVYIICPKRDVGRKEVSRRDLIETVIQSFQLSYFWVLASEVK